MYAIYMNVHMQSLNYNSAYSCVAYISHINISSLMVHKLYVSLMVVK